jgi:hypothetical protein
VFDGQLCFTLPPAADAEVAAISRMKPKRRSMLMWDL